jgi:hypothetical protein
MSEEVPTQEGKIVSTLLLSFVFLIGTAALPYLTLEGLIMPESETSSTWFQRSGSIMVLLALTSEYMLFSIHKLVYMTGIWDEHLWPMRIKYGKPHTVLSLVSFMAAAVGTIIWGYGDLIEYS